MDHRGGGVQFYCNYFLIERQLPQGHSHTSYKFAISKPVSSPPPPQPRPRIFIIDGLSAVCQGKFAHCIDQLINKIPNSSAQRRATSSHQVFPPYPNTALNPPTRPGPSIPIDCCSEGSLIYHARRWIGKKLTNRRRCTSFTQPRNEC